MADIVSILRSRGTSTIRYAEISAAADEIEVLRDCIAKQNELLNNYMIQLARYQVKEGKVGGKNESK